MTFRSQRKAFDTEVLGALRRAVKSSPWKMKLNSIFREIGPLFMAVRISVFLNDNKTSAVLEVKPMAIDSLYWEITHLEENERLPLSFRAWGAFCCSALPVSEITVIDDAVEADAIAAKLLAWADAETQAIVPEFTRKNFSSAISRHENQAKRGAYAISLVVSLIQEGNIEKARRLASSYLDGSAGSAGKHTHGGKDFHELAIEWIDQNASAA